MRRLVGIVESPIAPTINIIWLQQIQQVFNLKLKYYVFYTRRLQKDRAMASKKLS